MQPTSVSHSNAWHIFKIFLRLGCTSFGGPIAHLGYFRKEFVEHRHWLSEAEYAELVALCQFLPGPASSQVGFSLGLRQGGVPGALAAFFGFTLPSVVIMALAAVWLVEGLNFAGGALVSGLKLVALVVVADAVLGMAKKLCSTGLTQSIALITMIILLVMPSVFTQLLVILLAAGVGFLFAGKSVNPAATSVGFAVAYRSWSIPLFILFLLLLLVLPLSHSAWLQLASNSYEAGALVFGGGHVVLPLLQQSFVGSGQITDSVFLAGYGVAQALPGPLFSFSAYLGALAGDSFSLLGILIASIFIFLPGFLLLLVALPIWQQVQRNSLVRSALIGVNAAVVGLLAAALYDPVFVSAVNSATSLAIALAGILMLRVWQRPPLWVVAWCVGAALVLL